MYAYNIYIYIFILFMHILIKIIIFQELNSEDSEEIEPYTNGTKEGSKLVPFNKNKNIFIKKKFPVSWLTY